MTKKSKKVICIILATVLILMCTVTVFAADNGANEKISDSSNAIIVEVNSQEEFDMVVNEIERHNRVARSLWEKALKESEAMSDNTERPMVMATSGYGGASTTYTDHIGLLTWAYLGFSSAFNTGTNSYGSKIITSVRYVDAYGRSNGTTVHINDYDYRLIDSARTIATNYSCRVGVKSTDSNGQASYTYYTRYYYVEFHVGGSARVYD